MKEGQRNIRPPLLRLTLRQVRLPRFCYHFLAALPRLHPSMDDGARPGRLHGVGTGATVRLVNRPLETDPEAVRILKRQLALFTGQETAL